jgi:hypothetical protein
MPLLEKSGSPGVISTSAKPFRSKIESRDIFIYNSLVEETKRDKLAVPCISTVHTAKMDGPYDGLDNSLVTSTRRDFPRKCSMYVSFFLMDSSIQLAARFRLWNSWMVRTNLSYCCYDRIGGRVILTFLGTRAERSGCVIVEIIKLS